MKKIITMLLFLTFILGGCSCKQGDTQLDIPAKSTPTETSTITTPINATNLDKYLFRDDVQYVDLREYDLIAKTGHIAGFEFIPFHSLIASFRDERTLYKMKDSQDENGKWTYAGTIGGFYPQYNESKQLIKSLFDSEKYIFFVSHAGSESTYMINLLIQLGYDGNKLYNICGISGTEGGASYISSGNMKYFVGGSNAINVQASYNFGIPLTPIE